jgi:hypothetical protein
LFRTDTLSIGPSVDVVDAAAMASRTVLDGGNAVNADFEIWADNADAYPELAIAVLMSFSIEVAVSPSVDVVDAAAMASRTVLDGGNAVNADFEIWADNADAYPELAIAVLMSFSIEVADSPSVETPTLDVFTCTPDLTGSAPSVTTL